MHEGDLIAGRYRLLRPIGAGGMGTVWAARHELLGRDFALKVASVPERDPEAHARFLREAQIVGRLRHPNVVDVADVGDVAPGAGLYLAMELLEGESLADRIDKHGALPVSDALAIASQVARGLAAAHAAGVVHRDIKPENIFLARGPTGGMIPKLLDFGISKGPGGEARVTARGKVLGTPAYMSPEQAMGEAEVDQRADVWAMGVVLHEMIAGRRPFEGPNYQALIASIAENDPEPLPVEVAPEVRAIVERCLQKAPAARYPSAEALRAAIEAAREAPAAASPRSTSLTVERDHALPSLQPRRGAGAQGSTWSTLAVGALAFAVAGGAGIWRVRRMPSASDARTNGAPTMVDAPTTTTAPSSTGATANASATTAPSAAATVIPATATALPTASPAPATTTRPVTTPAKSRPGGKTKPLTRVNSAGF